MTARGTGLGKLILCGEHAVVYGHPALAFAVDRHTEVVLEPTDGPRTLDTGGLSDPRLDAALDSLFPAEGLGITIRTTLPIGRGMGSSAALSVALVRAHAAHAGEDPDPDAVFERAMPLERIFHGNPSGLDAAVASRGGFLDYRRGPPARIVAVDVGEVPWSVVVLDTGVAGDTARLVAHVASLGEKATPTLERIGALVGEARAALTNPQALGELLDENQALLDALGVSSSDNRRLVELARGAGAHGAKLSGAGGGGVVLALVSEPEPVLDAARKAGVEAFAARVGVA